jgi:hypothetical protein
MPRNSTLIQARDEHIRARFRSLCKTHPQWRTDAILDMIAREVWLSSVMVAKILKKQEAPGVPDASTISRRMQRAQATV